MSQESPKSNVLIVVAVLGAISTIVASAIGAISNYNTEKLRQDSEMTKIAVIAVATQGGLTQQAMVKTVNAPAIEPPEFTSSPTDLDAMETPPARTPMLTPSSELASNIIFVEKFDDNNNGWSLDESTRLSQGELAVTVNKGDWTWVTLPNVKVDGDFYVQAEMLLSEGHACFSAMGFALGKADVSQDSFLFSGFGCSGGRVGLYEDNSEVFSTLTSDFWLQPNVRYSLGLESKNGLYTLYINGKNMDSTALSPKGSDIGVYLRTLPSTKATFFIDNLVLTNGR